MNLLENKIVLVGPYVGSFREEILSFRPFFYWFKTHFKSKNVFVSTHYTSSFLYREEKNVHIFKHFTHQLKNQLSHLHDGINSYDYQVIKKSIIDDILEISSYKKTDIVSYDLGYSNNINITQSQKVFLPIETDFEKHNQILFIIDNIRKPRENKKLILFFQQKYPMIEVINSSDYTPEEMVKLVLGSKGVIVPSGHYTLISNLHKIPVMSWGSDISLFKNQYRFDNELCYLIKADELLNFTCFEKTLLIFLRRLEEC